MLRELPAVFTAGPACASLRAPAKLLLHQLLPERADYLRLKDEATLRHAARAVAGNVECQRVGAGIVAMMDDVSSTAAAGAVPAARPKTPWRFGPCLCAPPASIVWHWLHLRAFGD